jgi:capsular exopolysaccharide synthesis family protein
VITSAETGDGKTLVAANLSLSLGQLGAKRVLLVDGDLRIANVSRIFNLRQAPGIGDFLQGNVPFEAVIRKTQIPALAIAPAGTTSKKVLPELLQGPRWSEFLDQAKQEFDLVVVDTIPISAPVVDLELLTEPCDAVLLVVRMRQTKRQALKRVASRLDAKKFLGVIINNADEIYEYDYGYVNTKE